MDIMNFLGKCEYFNGNSGSAYVTHTLVFFSRLSLSEFVPMSVFVLSSDAPEELLDFSNEGVDVLAWGRPNYLGSEISRYQKCYI